LFLILTAKTKLTNNKTKTPTKTNKKPATKLGMHIQITDLLKKVCLCWAFVKSSRQIKEPRKENAELLQLSPEEGHEDDQKDGEPLL